MQHTDKYNLNIIETTDAFGPEPLNENTRALEAQLDAVRDEFAAADADLSVRMGTLETGRLLWKLGSYSGNGGYGSSSRSRLEFDFNPIAIVIIHSSNAYFGSHFWVRGASQGVSYGSGAAGSSASVYLTWGSNSVEWFNTSSADYQLNRSGIYYAYLALGTEN